MKLESLTLDTLPTPSYPVNSPRYQIMSDPYSYNGQQGITSFRNQSSTTLPMVGNDPPMKKKRGRPPNPASLTSKISSTMNISVNTSPLDTSPSAASYSQQILKRGAPDFVKPVMRVSPSPHYKKQRKNSSTSGTPTLRRSKSSSASAPTPLHNVDMTPKSLNGTTYSPYQINSKALENISMITQSTGVNATPQYMNLQPNNTLTFYNTPPSSSMKAQFPNFLNTPRFDSNDKVDTSSFPTPTTADYQGKLMNANMRLQRLPIMKLDNGQTTTEGSPNSQNLLPAVAIQQSKAKKSVKKISRKSPRNSPNLGPGKELKLSHPTNFNAKQNNDFLLKLLIDSLGKAVLSSDFFNSNPKDCGTPDIPCFLNDARDSLPKPKSRKSSPPLTSKAKRSKSPPKETPKPKLAHSHSVIGIESQYLQKHYQQQSILSPPASLGSGQNPQAVTGPNLLRRHNSDFTGVSASSILTQNPTLTSINENWNFGSHQTTPSSTGLQLPLTPKAKENYLYCSTGLTPGGNMGFNLTPQLNSMMYAVMNINSPQLKKGVSNQPFIMNQEFFVNDTQPETFAQGQNQMQDGQNYTFHFDQLSQELAAQHETIYMNDLMTLGINSPNKISISKPPTDHNFLSTSGSAEDSGDARLALKKIIHIKRK